VDQAINAVPNPDEATSSDVFQQKLGRVPGPACLLGREVAVLNAGRPVETVPGRLLGGGRHAQIVTAGLVLFSRSMSIARYISPDCWTTLIPMKSSCPSV
jgi:hypothetical protein